MNAKIVECLLLMINTLPTDEKRALITGLHDQAPDLVDAFVQSEYCMNCPNSHCREPTDPGDTGRD